MKSILYKNSHPPDLVDKCIKEFLYKILAPKHLISTVPKKYLVLALPYSGKLRAITKSFQMRSRINPITKNKLPHCNIQSVSSLSAKLVAFLHLKTKFYYSYVLGLFTNFGVAAMLPVMEKLNIILRSECVNTWKFLHSLILQSCT